MTGQELKEKLLAVNVPFNEIAERLGITAQSLNSCFKGKDVRSNTIERIAKALGVDMSFFYPSDNSSVAQGQSNVAGNNNAVDNVTIGDGSVLMEKIKYLEQQVQDKERLILEKERLLQEKERTIKILMRDTELCYP